MQQSSSVDTGSYHQSQLLIRGNRIEKVSDASTAQPPAGASVVDLSSAVVLPGLIDSHTHIFLWGEDPAKGGYDANILNAGIALRAARATFAVRRALEQGFTTLRDVETEVLDYPMVFKDFTEYWEVNSSIGGPVAEIVRNLNADDRADVRAAVEEFSAPFKTPEGLALPARRIFVRAR